MKNMRGENIERICLVVASEMTILAFLRHQIIALAGQYDVTLVVNTDNPDFATQHDLPATVVPLAIERAISPLSDFRALFSLVSLFRKSQFDLVHSVTPKAGLLAMLAGKMAGVEYRIHTFTGQVWATKQGYSRLLLKSMDRLLASSASHLLADSASQRKFLVAQGVCSEDKLSVLADGSISGVDTERFRPDPAIRSAMRTQIGLQDDDILLLFLGRLNRDKGIVDLARAFASMAENQQRLHLLLVGPDEAGIKDEVTSICAAHAGQLHLIDYTDKPESCFAASDLFCLPSYREGFGSVIIEAAACGLPAIGSDIYGVSDAIKDGQTGVLFEAGNVDALAAAIDRLCSDEKLRKRMGAAALSRAREQFPVNRLVQAWLEYYDGLP